MQSTDNYHVCYRLGISFLCHTEGDRIIKRYYKGEWHTPIREVVDICKLLT